MEKQRKSKEVLAKIGSGIASCLVFILVAGMGLNSCGRTVESIPKNARIVINSQTKEWLPNSEKFRVNIVDRRRSEKWEDAEWNDIRGKKFDLPEGVETYFESYTTGKDVGIVQALIFRGGKRWNQDGTWNY